MIWPLSPLPSSPARPLDADSGMIVDANPFLETLLGYTHDKFVGKALWDLGPFRDVAASRATLMVPIFTPHDCWATLWAPIRSS